MVSENIDIIVRSIHNDNFSIADMHACAEECQMTQLSVSIFFLSHESQAKTILSQMCITL